MRSRTVAMVTAMALWSATAMATLPGSDLFEDDWPAVQAALDALWEATSKRPCDCVPRYECERTGCVEIPCFLILFMQPPAVQPAKERNVPTKEDLDKVEKVVDDSIKIAAASLDKITKLKADLAKVRRDLTQPVNGLKVVVGDLRDDGVITAAQFDALDTQIDVAVDSVDVAEDNLTTAEKSYTAAKKRFERSKAAIAKARAALAIGGDEKCAEAAMWYRRAYQMATDAGAIGELAFDTVKTGDKWLKQGTEMGKRLRDIVAEIISP